MSLETTLIARTTWYVLLLYLVLMLTLLGPQSRFGDKSLGNIEVCPQIRTAVLTGLIGTTGTPGVPASLLSVCSLALLSAVRKCKGDWKSHVSLEF